MNRAPAKWLLVLSGTSKSRRRLQCDGLTRRKLAV
jgi:hypothetical protein